jgi:predicted PurR-regulated permease PerM
MMTAFGMVGIIIAFVAIIVFLDWWASRRDRQSRNRAA